MRIIYGCPELPSVLDAEYAENAKNSGHVITVDRADISVNDDKDNCNTWLDWAGDTVGVPYMSFPGMVTPAAASIKCTAG